MDLDERIARRRRPDRGVGLVERWTPLDPTVHLDEPVGRGSTVERLLDVLEPVFRGDVPANAYVHGPAGSGKSAVVSALIEALRNRLSHPTDAIGTTTRATTEQTPTFAYVDARRDGTPFQLYRAALAAATDTTVPERGIGTDALRERLSSVLDERPGAVVVVDHVGEPGTLSLGTVRELFDPLSDTLSWVAVGRAHPASIDGRPPSQSVSVPSYRQPTLVDVLTTRASRGLRRGLSHDRAVRLSGWSEGDAHDALAALFGAACHAEDAGRETLSNADLEVGMNAVPRDGAPASLVFALPENRKQVLDQLLALDLVGAELDGAADAIGDASDLSATTVKRFLYELAEDGILARVRPETGRGPSRIEPRFPTLVYRKLRERRS